MTKREFINKMKEIKQLNAWKESHISDIPIGPWTCNAIRDILGHPARQHYEWIFSRDHDSAEPYLPPCFQQNADVENIFNRDLILKTRIAAITLFEEIVLDEKLYIWL